MDPDPELDPFFTLLVCEAGKKLQLNQAERLKNIGQLKRIGAFFAACQL
jgi:hypothetical protein